MTDQEKLKRAYVEWQTRALASFIISTAQIDESGHRALSGMIEGLSMDGENEARVVDTTPVTAGIAGQQVPDADPYAYIDEDPQAAIDRALAKNGPGSFERFMVSARGG